ncbi:MAG TPA: hypothetical protein VHU41_09470 [Thermoanaerobaculia bacterium]|jgi:hypothetical protein|nr:hypothetical protein [Thermoanaerobaculia bacterium]
MTVRRRYPAYTEGANDVLDFARDVRRLAAKYPDDANPSDILQHIDGLLALWALDLLDIVLDHEERQTRFVARWRKWRKLRRPRRSV